MDSQPAWLRHSRMKTTDITSEKMLLNGKTETKSPKEKDKPGSEHTKLSVTKGGVKASFEPKNTKVSSGRGPTLNTAAQANFSPEFLLVFDEVLNIESADEYEEWEPEVDYIDIPEVDYEQSPQRPVVNQSRVGLIKSEMVQRKHQTIAARRSLDIEGNDLRTPSMGRHSSTQKAHPPLQYRHSSGTDGRYNHTQSRTMQHSQGISSLPNIPSGSGKLTLPRDFAPNLRITAAHQARLLRDRGRPPGGNLRLPRYQDGTGEARKIHSGSTGRSRLAPHQDLYGTYSGPPQSGSHSSDDSKPASRQLDSSYRRGSTSSNVTERRERVLRSLQTAMDSGWFYGYGIVVKNLKERMEYISKHQTDKPHKSMDITTQAGTTRDRRVSNAHCVGAGMTRELAVEILRRQEVGSYVIRDSTSHPGDRTISIKTARGKDRELINHFLILRTSKGLVKLKDFPREWANMKVFTDYLTTGISKDADLIKYLGIR